MPVNVKKPVSEADSFNWRGVDLPYHQYSREGNAAQIAVDGFLKIFGRPPSADELAQALPAYLGTDKNIQDKSAGDAFVAQLHTATENTPDKLYAKQQAEYAANAPKFADQVQGLFQGQLGRAASQDELNHFGSLLASGTTDSYQLQQFLQQQPEYQTKQNQQFTAGLSDKLAGFDKQYFQDQILPALQESYAKQGRSFDSSAFQNATTQSAQQQNVARQQYLAQLSAQQYGGVQDRAYQDYASQVANQQNLTNSGIQAQYAGIQNAQSRSNQFTDFNIQNQMYNQYLAKYGKRNNGLGGLIGGVAGTGIGAFFGGPTGALIGNSIGSGLGNAVGGGSY